MNRQLMQSATLKPSQGGHMCRKKHILHSLNVRVLPAGELFPALVPSWILKRGKIAFQGDRSTRPSALLQHKHNEKASGCAEELRKKAEK